MSKGCGHKPFLCCVLCCQAHYTSFEHSEHLCVFKLDGVSRTALLQLFELLAEVAAFLVERKVNKLSISYKRNKEQSQTASVASDVT
jgi:hypothetical protein